MVRKLTDTKAHADKSVLASSGSSNKANIFLGLIEYELNSLLSASQPADYISVHIRFDVERYLLIIRYLPLKYWLIFLQVLKVSDEPLGESNAERRVKILVSISKGRYLIISKYLSTSNQI